MIFKIALLQLSPTNSVEQNVAKGLNTCKKAQSLGADLVLFPEMWQLNYNSNLMALGNAIDHSDTFIQIFCKQAKNLNMAIALTYLGKGKNKPTNNIVLIDNKGTIVLDYAKVHVCDFEDGTEITLEPGNKFKVTTLNFAGGSVKVGAMICFDREFPESARTLMLKGAEIIVVPNACPLRNDPIIGDVRLAQIRSRAFENMVGIAVTNYAQPKADGCSCAFNVDGKQLVMANEQEEIVFAHFDLDKIRKWRSKEVWGNKHRRVDVYEH